MPGIIIKNRYLTDAIIAVSFEQETCHSNYGAKPMSSRAMNLFTSYQDGAIGGDPRGACLPIHGTLEALAQVGDLESLRILHNKGMLNTESGLDNGLVIALQHDDFPFFPLCFLHCSLKLHFLRT